MMPPVLDNQRPRERLWTLGTERASDSDLLTVLLGSGVRGRPVRQVADDLLRRCCGLAGLSRATPHELARTGGVGAARAAQLAASFELGRRSIEQHAARRASLARAEHVFERVKSRYRGIMQELFVALGVDVRNRLVIDVEVARGVLTGVEVHPREVFRPLIRAAAAGVILVHNHPSGDPAPSLEDLDLTRRLRDVGQLIGIPVIDHIIVGDNGYCSVAEWLGTDF